MVNSQATPNAILANLLEADTALAAQEATLTTQLQEVREKRQSLKTVIDLFSIPSATSDSSHPVEKTATLASVAIESAAPASDISSGSAIPAFEELVEERSEQPRSASKQASSTPRSRASKASKSSKTTKPSKNWQDYLQPAFRRTSLPTAIAAVFQQQPQEILSVSNLMDSIFEDRLPSDLRNAIRHRMLNILSTGAKEGQWYRGQRGLYSLSQAVAEPSR